MRWFLLALISLSLVNPADAHLLNRRGLTVSPRSSSFLASGPITTITTSTTLTGTNYTVLVDATSAAVVVTLPLCAGANKRIYNIKKVDSSVNAVTITPGGSDTIDGDSSVVIYAQYNSYTIHCAGGTVWYNL